MLKNIKKVIGIINFNIYTLYSLKVDELETGEYNDVNFWKFNSESQIDHLNDCLKDLDL